MTLLEGAASPEGTRRFRDRAVATRSLPSAHFRDAPGGLALTSLGLGTYIGRVDRPTDLAVEEAVRVSIESGRLNVVDTAINYRYQRAERSVGRALAGLVASGKVARDEVFVATKVGYLAPDGESGRSPEEWVEAELVRPGLLDPAEIVDGSHAMSPPYLRDQVERSRRNLGLETLDLLYLHNAPDAQRAVVGASEFRSRLGDAFRLLEELRDDGALRAYGLATWEALRSPAAAPEHLEIEEALEVAREVGGADHGLRYLQFPFNLAMPEAAVRACQSVNGEPKTVFACARHYQLGCFTSVPLVQGQLAQRGPALDGLTRSQTALQFARSAPGTIAALVGQKQPAHLAENLKVAEVPPLSEAAFAERLAHGHRSATP